MATSEPRQSVQPTPPIAPITTDRLVLRPTDLTDAPALERIHGSDETTRYLSHNPLNPAQVREWIAADLAHAAASTATAFRYAWAIQLRESGRVIGEARTWTTRNPPEPDHLGPGQADLGYVLDPAFHRRGYGREAALALIGWLFTQRDIRTAFAEVFEPNLASQALLRSLGFTPYRWFTAEQDQSVKGLPFIRFRLDRPDPA